MNTAMATAHWRRATRALSAANRCAIGGEYEDAISRAYYSMMHAAKAVLATKGIAAKSHSAVQRLFSEHLIRSGEIERERASDLGTARQSRTTADYDAWTEATEEEGPRRVQTGHALPDRDPAIPADERPAGREPVTRPADGG